MRPLQAVPRPLFTFSAYLVLPICSALRHQPVALAALRGTNAAVVGVLLAALWHQVSPAGIVDAGTLVLAAGSFVALWFGKIPPWAVVMAAAGAGALWF